MKYLCLVYVERERLAATSAADCLAYAAELGERGLCLAAEALEAEDGVATVLVRNGSNSVVDGPFAETKELLAGFYVLKTRDLNEAVQIAARIPAAPAGRVEIRPVLELGEAPRRDEAAPP